VGKVDERHKAAMESLHPVFRTSVENVLDRLEEKGWKPVVVYGKRTEAQQAELIAEGVGGKKSWHVPSTQGLLPRGNRAVDVIRGAAADVIDRRWAWNGPCANKDHQFWKDLGAIAKETGLEWGGDWKKRDVAHIQMKLVEDRPLTNVRV
jgi:hypothetical protein